MACFNYFLNYYVHVLKEPVLPPTTYVNGPDIEVSIYPLP